MRLNPARFNRLLGVQGAGLGQRVRWERASLCPCRSGYDGSPDPSCPACRGKGVQWQAPLDAHLGLTSAKVAREWAQFGQWESGDVVFTLPPASPAWMAGENDRITLADSTVPFQRLQTRGTPNEAWGRGVVTVERIMWRHPDTDLPVEGSTAVTLDAAGLPTWPDGAAAPPPGTAYAVDGRRNPSYFLLKELPQDRAHHGGAALPRRVAGRLFDLWGR